MGSEQGVGGRVLLVDLGGGSCEITLSEKKRIKETISVPLGAVRLTEEFLPVDPAPADGLGRMRRWIARELRRAHRRIQPAGTTTVIATSGTAAALSDAVGSKSASQRVSKSAGQRVGKLAGVVDTRDVRKLATKLAKLSLPDREAVPGIGPRRAEIIVAGAEVFAELLESFGMAGFRYSPLGLRDGILRRCSQSRTRGPRSTRSLSTNGGRACWRRRAATVSIRAMRSR